LASLYAASGTQSCDDLTKAAVAIFLENVGRDRLCASLKATTGNLEELAKARTKPKIDVVKTFGLCGSRDPIGFKLGSDC
jgi:hypothetical protein